MKVYGLEIEYYGGCAWGREWIGIWKEGEGGIGDNSMRGDSEKKFFKLQ
jgi:hypothetical protein